MLERPLCENIGACFMRPSTVLPSDEGSEYELGAATEQFKYYQGWTFMTVRLCGYGERTDKNLCY